MADSTATADIGSYLAQYGLFGLIFIDAFITRKVLMPIWAHKDAMKAQDNVILDRDAVIKEKNTDIKELKTNLDKLQTMTRDQMLPALVRANQLSADYLAEITRRDGTVEPRKATKRAPRKKVE